MKMIMMMMMMIMIMIITVMIILLTVLNKNVFLSILGLKPSRVENATYGEQSS